MPREAFEDFIALLMPADAGGLSRDASTGWLVPTSTSKKLRRWHYAVRKGSVSNRLFGQERLDPPAPPPRPARKRKAVEVQEVDGVGGEILQHRFHAGRNEWLMKCVGWDEIYNSWEPGTCRRWSHRIWAPCV